MAPGGMQSNDLPAGESRNKPSDTGIPWHCRLLCDRPLEPPQEEEPLPAHRTFIQVFIVSDDTLLNAMFQLYFGVMFHRALTRYIMTI